MRRVFMFAGMFLYFACLGHGQTVVIDKKPMTISPKAEIGNKIRLKWAVMKQASMMIQLIDKNRRVLKTLDAGKMDPAEYNIIYDGKDAEGNILSPGEYTIRIGINPKIEPDLLFGVDGILGKVTKTFKFAKDRSFSLGVKGIDPKTVKVFVDGEQWEQEQDFSIAGNNFVVDATSGVVKLNPQGDVQENAEIEISFCVGLPLENPWALATTPEGDLLIVDNLYSYDGLLKKPKPRIGYIYKVNPAGKLVEGFASKGMLEASVKDIAVDGSGNIYANPFDHYVMVLDSKGVLKYKIAGYKASPKEGEALGGYWITGIGLDRENMRILLVNINEKSVIYDATKPGFEGYITVLGPGEGYRLPPVYWQYWCPCADAFNDDFYQTTSYHSLVKYHLDYQGKKIVQIWNTPDQDPTGQTEISSAPGVLWHAMGVKTDGTGIIYVANRNNHRIEVFFDAGSTYKYVCSLGSKGIDVKQGQMMAPHAVALSPDGKSIFIADDGVFIKHGKEPVVKGLGRVTKMNLGFEETIEIPLTVK